MRASAKVKCDCAAFSVSYLRVFQFFVVNQCSSAVNTGKKFHHLCIYKYNRKLLRNVSVGSHYGYFSYVLCSSLNQLCQVLSMKVAVRNSLFPTAEMVRSLSKEFGSLPEKGQRVLEDICQAARGATQRQRGRVKSKPPTEDHNQQYVEWKQLVAAQQLCGETKDFVRVLV